MLFSVTKGTLAAPLLSYCAALHYTTLHYTTLHYTTQCYRLSNKFSLYYYSYYLLRTLLLLQLLLLVLQITAEAGTAITASITTDGG